MPTHSRGKLHFEIIVILLAMVFALTLLSTPTQAQFRVLHSFTGGSDGANPNAGVTVGGSGILYGTTSGGGTGGLGDRGVVFKLTQRGSGWTVSPLYEFTGGVDGDAPYSGITIGPNGRLYGTTYYGGSSDAGTVYELRPPAAICKSATCYWTAATVWSFGSGNDGSYPENGYLTFDRAGNIYGTTYQGGTHGYGVVFQLSPQSGGSWTENILYNFTDASDGGNPLAGVIFDSAGNLYGNDSVGGTESGVIYKLTSAGPPWAEHTLANFLPGTGTSPSGQLIMDQSGNLYGTGEANGPSGSGTVYELSPSGGGWTLSVVYAFGYYRDTQCAPFGGVTLGPNGNLFGACQIGGANGVGWVYEMPATCNQTCTPTDLYDFTGSVDCYAHGPVSFDASDNLYGTCYGGGNSGSGCNADGCGTVWEIEGVTNRHEK
jgi:uncharacterized repeat protein (TIGR03803 family)